MSNVRQAAKIIAEMRKLLPGASHEQREQIVTMIENYIDRLQPINGKQQSDKSDYLDER